MKNGFGKVWRGEWSALKGINDEYTRSPFFRQKEIPARRDVERRAETVSARERVPGLFSRRAVESVARFLSRQPETLSR